MRKLKYTLLFVMLIFGLNSCLTTMVGWGICEQYGCTPSPKEKDSNGVEIFARKKPSEIKSYLESIKKRTLKNFQIKTKTDETFFVNIPENFMLKKYDQYHYYLYDNEKKIGFGVSIWDTRDTNTGYIKKIYERTHKKYKYLNANKGVYVFISEDKKTIIKIKKITENYYAFTEYFIEDVPKEIQDIYVYFLENL